ncbi:MAG: serine hydrolase [Planctomycetaceae bacterium]
MFRPLLHVVCLSLPLCAADTDKTTLYFPPTGGDRWEHIDPVGVGWDPAKLKETLAFAGRNRSSAVVLVYRGRILAEQYWQHKPTEKMRNGQPNPYFHMLLGQDANGRPIEDIASAQKSVTAMLVGIAQHKGFLKLDDPVHKHLGPGWSRAAAAVEKPITIRHLVTMTSGLDTRLRYAAPAGTKWVYNTAAYSRSLTCVARASKMKPDELTRKWLTGPLGMQDSRWTTRTWIRLRPDVNHLGFATSARDLARFGLLMLARGNWNGKNVLADKGYLRAATSPSQKLNPAYGYLWWLNGGPFVLRGTGTRKAGRLLPAAPPDMFAAQGKLNRRLYVLPSQQLVITRLGDQPDRSFDSEFFKRLRRARNRAATP